MVLSILMYSPLRMMVLFLEATKCFIPMKYLIAQQMTRSCSYFQKKNIAGRVHLHSTSSSGLVPVVTSNNSSVTVALSHSSIGRQESIQYKLFEPSSSQELHELLLGSIRSWNRPQVGANEGFRQNIQAFTNIWSESELDSLWVGVRRHGKDNWYAMLRDPKLRFSPCRTEMDLAKQWIIEQTKLLGSTPSPSCPNAKPVGIRMPPSFVPPGPGSMTRFLTEPPQISLSNGSLNSQEMLPPRPPQNVTSGLGKGTRLLNQHVRAHRRSQNSENTWGRFKARDSHHSLFQLYPFSMQENLVNSMTNRIARGDPHPLKEMASVIQTAPA
ncbi:hypothetical protein QQ045_032168 [Rhodiola kirilowii]